MSSGTPEARTDEALRRRCAAAEGRARRRGLTRAEVRLDASEVRSLLARVEEAERAAKHYKGDAEHNGEHWVRAEVDLTHLRDQIGKLADDLIDTHHDESERLGLIRAGRLVRGLLVLAAPPTPELLDDTQCGTCGLTYNGGKGYCDWCGTIPEPTTEPRPHRYDQCDETCTVDCGHCKGNGPPPEPTTEENR